MVRFGERKIEKENFYAAKRPTIIWDFNVDNIVISKLIKTKVKEEDKNKNNKLMSFRIDDEKLLEKYNAIWTKI